MFFNHSKKTKNEKDMRFEIRNGFKFFFQNIWNKISTKLQLKSLLHGAEASLN
jgi:hypothetical protein